MLLSGKLKPATVRVPLEVLGVVVPPQAARTVSAVSATSRRHELSFRFI
jgi:hypothetical protein